MTEITVPLVSRRRERVQLFQKFQHAVPAPVLIGDGIHRLTERAALWSVGLGVAEVGASAVVIVALVRAIRDQRKPSTHAHHAHGIDWIDIFLGVMVLVEALVHYQETGRIPAADDPARRDADRTRARARMADAARPRDAARCA